jgi:hypothetical protein
VEECGRPVRLPGDPASAGRAGVGLAAPQRQPDGSSATAKPQVTDRGGRSFTEVELVPRRPAEDAGSTFGAGMGPELRKRQAVEPAILVRVCQNSARNAGRVEILPRRDERPFGRLTRSRLRPRFGLRGCTLQVLAAPQGIDGRGKPEGGDGPDQEPGGDRSDRDGSVVPRIRTCRWLSWFQRTSTTPRGPSKPVFGPM